VFIGVGVIGASLIFIALRKYFSSSSEKKRPVALDPTKKIAFEMIEKEVLYSIIEARVYFYSLILKRYNKI
jgi:hypothetical protein